MVLDDIVKAKMKELARRKRSVSLSRMKERAVQRGVKTLDFAAALKGDGVQLIAEVKRSSPSKGMLCPDLDHVELARTYVANGAAAVSVLTEEQYFGGSPEQLAEVKAAIGQVPVLMKDFIFEPYQIYECRACGADALLLIAAMLSSLQLEELLSLSRALGMRCLVEVHDEEELERALSCGAMILGINNRDLRTFKVNLETTGRLRPLIPPDRVVVSESGIRSRDDVERMRGWGVDAVLVGETLVTAPDVAAKMRELL
jgi:indole-3-glycerol phosphate synthase